MVIQMPDLEETIELMTSSDYVDRFRAEFWQLSIRYHKLRDIISRAEDDLLDFRPACPLYILRIQLEEMNEYLQTLQERAEIEGIDLEWQD